MIKVNNKCVLVMRSAQAFVFGVLFFIIGIGVFNSCNTLRVDNTTALINDRTKTGIFLSMEEFEIVTTRPRCRVPIIERIDVFINNRNVGSFRFNYRLFTMPGEGNLIFLSRMDSRWEPAMLGHELGNGNHTMHFTLHFSSYWSPRPGVIRRWTWPNSNGQVDTIPTTFTISGNRLQYNLTDISLFSDRRVDIRPRLARNEPVEALIDRAVVNSFFQVSNALVGSAIIAVDISATARINERDAEFIREELTSMLANSGHTVVARGRTLDAIQREFEFQMSGAVSDDSWVSIGNFLGANVVITGDITGEGERRTLRLRALDVRTGRILASPAERLQ